MSGENAATLRDLHFALIKESQRSEVNNAQLSGTSTDRCNPIKYCT